MPFCLTPTVEAKQPAIEEWETVEVYQASPSQMWRLTLPNTHSFLKVLFAPLSM